MPVYLHSQITDIFVHYVFILVWDYKCDATENYDKDYVEVYDDLENVVDKATEPTAG